MEASGDLVKAADSRTSPLKNTMPMSTESIIIADDTARRDSMDALNGVAVSTKPGPIPTPDHDSSKEHPRRTKRKQFPATSMETRERHSKKARSEAEVPAFLPPPALDAQEIVSDLEELGFSPERKRQIMEMDKDSMAWDAALPQYYHDEKKAQESQERKRLEKKGAAAMCGSKYEPLFLGSDTGTTRHLYRLLHSVLTQNL